MGIEKQGSKGGNYVGGFLQMFDWNAKSRKKLFSINSEVPEQSKQKKRCDGNLPKTHLAMMDVDENAAGSSVRGSSDHSCASSLVDEDFCVRKAPGVVARLMGLDSLPKSSMHEPYSTPIFSSCSLRDAYYQANQETELNHRRVMHKPIEKFQTETLPPKSAKSIPITHHKLLSPIKNANFIPSKDAAHIMEAAARIIEPGPLLMSTKTKMPSLASSAPLRVRDLKEKAQKPSKIFEGSRRNGESKAVKRRNGSVEASPVRLIPDSDESLPNGVKSKAKSISLALQAKANVQKRGGLTVNGSRSLVSQKESCQLSPNHPFSSQLTIQKTTVKRPSTQNGSSVLRQNNQKQNCIVDKGKLSSKCNLKGGDSFSTRQRSSSKASSTSRVNYRKMSSDVKDDKREVLSASKEIVTSKKRSADGSYHSGKNRVAGKEIHSMDTTDRQSSWDQDCKRMGSDVVSFTFTSPMARLGSDSLRPIEAGETSKILSTGYHSKRSLTSSDGTNGSSFSVHGTKGDDALSTLLEQKLKELADKIEFSQQKSGTNPNDMMQGLEASTSSSITESCKLKYVNQESCGRLPSPVSVLENSSFAESCSSSDTADSNSTGGSKQCSPIPTLEVLDSYSLKTYLAVEPDADLSDSASSTDKTNPKRWDFEYVKEILSDIELMFEDYAIGRTQHVVSPCLFSQLESCNQFSSNCGGTSVIDQRVLFDCVGECLDLRCRQYVGGGYRSAAKGLSLVRRNEILAQEVYREILGWNANVGDSMIDELVDKDMSNQHGRWLDFDVEAFELGMQIQSRILNSLIDEVVADILML